MSVDKQRNAILKHFVFDSQEYQPLKVDDLPKAIQDDLCDCVLLKTVPYLDLIMVKQALEMSNVTNTQASGDLPAKIRKEFLP